MTSGTTNMGNNSARDTDDASVVSKSKSLHRSAFIGNNNEIRRTLKDNKNIVDYQDEYGFTALMAASSGGRTETVQILLQSGAKLDITDKNGVTALMCAVQRGHIDVVDKLLESGARTDIIDNEGCNVYVVAGRAGYKNIISLLVDHDNKRKKVTKASEHSLRTPLKAYQVIKNGFYNSFLKQKSDKACENNNERTSTSTLNSTSTFTSSPAVTSNSNTNLTPRLHQYGRPSLGRKTLAIPNKHKYSEELTNEVDTSTSTQDENLLQAIVPDYKTTATTTVTTTAEISEKKKERRSLNGNAEVLSTNGEMVYVFTL